MTITDLIPIPPGINPNLSAAKQITMLSLLGNPRGSYSQECQTISHPVLAALLETRRVGKFRVSGLKPAVDGLERIMGDVMREQPEVFDALGTAGMLCARFVRGSSTNISNHSWGTAIDLTLNGKLDRRGDGLVQTGLGLIAPIFNRHGWYWGASFGTEDAMHFEASDQTIRSWHQAGLLLGERPLAAPGLSLGDRGPEVTELQTLLVKRGQQLKADGAFGPKTLDALRAFQRACGLEADGVATVETLAVLRGPAPTPAGTRGQLQAETLAVGDMGLDVRALQEQLNLLGHGLRVDGIFGRGTAAAVMAFQADQQLEVNGVADKLTSDRLAQMVG